jgi:hypothetical protein
VRDRAYTPGSHSRTVEPASMNSSNQRASRAPTRPKEQIRGGLLAYRGERQDSQHRDRQATAEHHRGYDPRRLRSLSPRRHPRGGERHNNRGQTPDLLNRSQNVNNGRPNQRVGNSISMRFDSGPRTARDNARGGNRAKSGSKRSFQFPWPLPPLNYND